MLKDLDAVIVNGRFFYYLFTQIFLCFLNKSLAPVLFFYFFYFFSFLFCPSHPFPSPRLLTFSYLRSFEKKKKNCVELVMIKKSKYSRQHHKNSHLDNHSHFRTSYPFSRSGYRASSISLQFKNRIPFVSPNVRWVGWDGGRFNAANLQQYPVLLGSYLHS